jgi:hypothetical protein
VAVVRLHRAVLRRLPDRPKRALLFREAHGTWPHGRSPRTFTEKVNWRVVNDRRPLIGRLGDKLAMRDHARQVCPGLRVPELLWAGTDLRALAAAPLPEHWVLKPNHGTMRVHLGTGRPDVERLRRITAGWLDEPLYPDRGEWAYSRARRLLLVEELLGPPGQPPVDHKFLAFGGRVHVVQVDSGRHDGTHRRRLYSRDWEPLSVVESVPAGPVTPPPASLPVMVATAEALGGGFDFVRVDLYDVDGTVVFGELTPYPGGGLDPFDPGLDRELGAAWVLPSRREVRGP